ncbi:MAG: hypothetical protein WBC05_24750 [Sedimentisphaerales bacterium]
MDPNTVETWHFVNSFAPWLAAFGTVAAVVTSLYLATRQTRVKLRVSAAHRLTVWTGQPQLPREVLNIEVVNMGLCDVQVTKIEWKAGILRKRYLYQTISSNAYSSALPVHLAHGEQAIYVIPFESWIKNFRQHLRPLPRLRVYLLSIQVGTSVGQIQKGRIEKELISKILKTLADSK